MSTSGAYNHAPISTTSATAPSFMPPPAQSMVTPEPEIISDHQHASWQSMTRTLAHYERELQIGEGTYGQVYRARCRDTNRVVALKKMRIHHGGYWGMPHQLIREIKILKRLRHPNLLRMIEVVTSKGVEEMDEDDPYSKAHDKDKGIDTREGYKGNLFLVLEYVTHDLAGLLDVAYQFTPVQIKCIFRQLLQALAYMHQNSYVHRDIKSSNILLDGNFGLKLADFGLARCLEPPIMDVQDRGINALTNRVITLWYRPPELLVGATEYGPAVDVWSAGCILAELLLGKPLFTGKTELDQLNLIVELMGSPSSDTADYLMQFQRVLSGEITLAVDKPNRLRKKYSEKMPTVALGFVEKLLELDPRKRLTAANALEHRYFWTQPVAPDNPADLGPIQVGVGGHFHEFQTKKKRKEAKAIAEEAKAQAKFHGASEEEAQDEFNNVYRELMKKVAEDGLDEKSPKKDEIKQGEVKINETNAVVIPAGRSLLRTELPNEGPTTRTCDPDEVADKKKPLSIGSDLASRSDGYIDRKRSHDKDDYDDRDRKRRHYEAHDIDDGRASRRRSRDGRSGGTEGDRPQFSPETGDRVDRGDRDSGRKRGRDRHRKSSKRDKKKKERDERDKHRDRRDRHGGVGDHEHGFRDGRGPQNDQRRDRKVPIALNSRDGDLRAHRPNEFREFPDRAKRAGGPPLKREIDVGPRYRDDRDRHPREVPFQDAPSRPGEGQRLSPGGRRGASDNVSGPDSRHSDIRKGGAADRRGPPFTGRDADMHPVGDVRGRPPFMDDRRVGGRDSPRERDRDRRW